ncbi:glycosyltransferase family 4 protein [Epibacterium ulvae]|uniref:glycosyltransferase family 4 protein n=1 Tax=Epibacterium ulvae TaxID=1156985 RepID=UPI001BFCC107|nr:glycosyltransferase family 4 protein [Epibacterium ulvae]MBT8153998.1 glycosyltransferase family 4 protein [Epibacterium ulvae]
MPPAPRIAFYAPMKSPDHPVPSGDREVARNLMRMMEHAGCSVDLVSTWRCRDKQGDPSVQAQFFDAATAEVERLKADLPAFDLWVTYHNYYKAPDLLGPALSQIRATPYVQIESTRALKRLDGPWDRFARAAHAAADHADLILSLTQRDQKTLIRDRFQDQSLAVLAPFLNCTDLPPASRLSGPMLSVGMMREGDKLASYKFIAESLLHLPGDWQLNIVGDGPARQRVEALFAPFGARVRFLGQLTRDALEDEYRNARLFFWPGVNEAFGMVYLEAQSFGLPVVAQNRPGVDEVLSPTNRALAPAPSAGPVALAAVLQSLNTSPAMRQSHLTDARAHTQERHLMPAAAQSFRAAITPLLERRQ